MTGSAITALHVAPHPDDESLAAIGTLLALRAAGHRVVNLACGLGRPEDQVRRGAEVTEACRRADFELIVPPHPIGLSRTDDLAAAQREVAALVAETIAREGAQLVISPSPHDGHHGHEAVGRGVRDALAGRSTSSEPIRWWMWGLWADLPLPTLFSGFDDARLEQAEHVLAAHAGELARNDYATLLRARAAANSVLGSERVFGWGERRRDAPYAELLTEAWRDGDAWVAGAPRTLDPAEPLAEAQPGEPLGWWLGAPSFRTQLASARAGRAPTSADRPAR